MKMHLPAAVMVTALFSAFTLFPRTSDNEFMMKASQANVAEVSAANLAMQKSKSTEIKSFAQQMVTDHSAAEKDLLALAQKKGMKLPTEPDADHKAMKEQLMSLAGAGFDSVYMKGQAADHQTAVALFSDESTNGTDKMTKAYASKYLPKLKDHLRMVAMNGKTGMDYGMAAMDSTHTPVDTGKTAMDSTR